ncbi:MAG: fructose-6-phosphate aldolase [Vampirovibrionales bacterium]|nr:fructose-6-phosphate aldolase [Vampirovibrionales bacterium]
MKLFLDSADLTEIREAASLGVISGVTTNPTLLAKSAGGKPVQAIIEEICALVPGGPVSMECVSDDAEGMIAEGRKFATWGKDVYVKVPFCTEGVKAVYAFSQENISTNVTLVFSLNQALLAANAGATLISSFVGRLDDIGFDGLQVIEQCVDMVHNYGFDAQILAASIRHPLHVTQSVAAGAHIATIPFKVLKQMYGHPLTTSGIAQFKADWEKVSA